MKPSHLQTPRTMGEATFTVGYSSVQSYRKQATGYPAAWWIAFCLVSLLAVVVIARAS
jgi:hypothetical protein